MAYSSNRYSALPLLLFFLIAGLGRGLFAGGESLRSLPDLTVAIEQEYADGLVRAGGALLFPPELEFVTQGGLDRQSDLSLRGSGFSAVELSIEGISLENPQTAHFNAELPLPPSIFMRPQIVTGIGQELLDDPALVGSVLLRLRPIEDGGLLQAGIGDYEHRRQSLEYARNIHRGQAGEAAGLGFFAARARSDGRDYDDNHLDMEMAGARLQHRAAGRQSDLVFGHRRKTFGARGYYGVSPQYSAEEELADTLVLASSKIGRSSVSELRINAMWREIEDDYRLDLPSGLYHNQHRSTVQKAGLTGSHGLAAPLGVFWGLDASNERIESRALGDHRRESAGIRVVPAAAFGALRLAGGARLKACRGLSPTWLPQLAAEFSLASGSYLYGSYTRTSRRPSFTELNYESPGSLGNAGLERQRSDNSELGIKTRLSDELDADLAVFHRGMDNAIDWLKLDADGRWTASNLGELQAAGLLARIRYSRRDGRFVCGLNYRYTDKSGDIDHYAGRYLLDYARHSLAAQIRGQLGSGLSVLARQGLRVQVDNPVRGSGDLGLPASVSADWRSAFCERFSLRLGVENLWNDQFQYLPGQAPADRSVFMAAAWEL